MGIALSCLYGSAQRTCNTMQHHEHLVQQDPNYLKNLEKIEQFTQHAISSGAVNAQKAVINIPVVVHVVYKTTAENISDAQIQSQINILNQDFRKLNADASKIPSAFTSVAADCEINFCLASFTPTGAATTGIVRKQTTVSSFVDDDKVKYTAQGGSDAWDTKKYLNLWVCNLGGGLLGYAQFPGGPAATDGVVMGYTCFGNTGTAQAPYNKGRTATHEVGHWLNLRHIWGDADCGSDLVSDTPTQKTSNYGCPTHPYNVGGCSGNTTGEMFMNYMDYVDDACMYMFSAGQKSRMQALFVSNGARVGLTTSTGCSGSTSTCSSPANLSTGSLTSTSATLTWGAVSGATSYSVQYKLSTASTWTTVTTTSASYNLTGLAASKTYNWQVSTTCSSGASAYTTGTTFTTSAATSTCSAPASLAAGSLTSTSAALSWGAVSGATSYSVQYKLSTASTWTTVTTTSTSYNLTGLTASSTYNWQVSTTCSSGTSAYTSGTNFTTSGSSNTCTDTYELNNTLSSSKTITVKTDVNAIIASKSDYDWFKFSNTTNEKNIRVTLTNLPADYDLRVYSATGTLLGASENKGTVSETVTLNNAAVGTYYIRIRGFNGAFNATGCYTVNAGISGTAYKFASGETGESILKDPIETAIQVYPNPSTTGKFTCEIMNASYGDVNILVYDAAGRVVSRSQFNKETDFGQVDIEIGNQQPGVYFVNMSNADFQQHVRVVYAN